MGGAYINGTAEAIFASDLGLAWCQAPFGYAISPVIGEIVLLSDSLRPSIHSLNCLKRNLEISIDKEKRKSS